MRIIDVYRAAAGTIRDYRRLLYEESVSISGRCLHAKAGGGKNGLGDVVKEKGMGRC